MMGSLEEFNALWQGEREQFWLPFVVQGKELTVVSLRLLALQMIVQYLKADRFPASNMCHDILDRPLPHGSCLRELLFAQAIDGSGKGDPCSGDVVQYLLWFASISRHFAPLCCWSATFLVAVYHPSLTE